MMASRGEATLNKLSWVSEGLSGCSMEVGGAAPTSLINDEYRIAMMQEIGCPSLATIRGVQPILCREKVDLVRECVWMCEACSSGRLDSGGFGPSHESGTATDSACLPTSVDED